MTAAYHVGPSQAEAAEARMRAAYSQAIRQRRHLWIVTAAHLLSDDDARAIASEQPFSGSILDHENLAHIAPGCFVCEEPLTAELYARPCPGEPR